jgi:hypothetical protein
VQVGGTCGRKPRKKKKGTRNKREKDKEKKISKQGKAWFVPVTIER